VKESPEQQADIARDAGSVTPIHDDTVQPPPPILSVLAAGRIRLPRRARKRRPGTCSSPPRSRDWLV